MAKKINVGGRITPPMKKILDILPYTVSEIVENFIIEKCIGKNTNIILSKIDKEIEYHEENRNFLENCLKREDKILVNLYNSKSIIKQYEDFDPRKTNEYIESLEEFERILQCRLDIWENQKFGRKPIHYSTAVDFAKKANVKTDIFLKDVDPELLKALEDK